MFVIVFICIAQSRSVSSVFGIMHVFGSCLDNLYMFFQLPQCNSLIALQQNQVWVGLSSNIKAQCRLEGCWEQWGSRGCWEQCIAPRTIPLLRPGCSGALLYHKPSVQPVQLLVTNTLWASQYPPWRAPTHLW